MKKYDFRVRIELDEDDEYERLPSQAEMKEWIEAELFTMGGGMHQESWQRGAYRTGRITVTKWRRVAPPVKEDK